MKTKQVFVSYFHGDKAIASKIASIFEQYNVTVWIDFGSIKPGEFITRHIEEGLRTSNYFTIVISANSISSRWVQAELAMAFDLSKDGRLILVPAKVEPDCKPYSANYRAMALTKYGMTYFNATPALCEDGNSCAYFWEASSGKWQMRFGIAVT
jgi:TIR domain